MDYLDVTEYLKNASSYSGGDENVLNMHVRSSTVLPLSDEISSDDENVETFLRKFSVKKDEAYEPDVLDVVEKYEPDVQQVGAGETNLQHVNELVEKYKSRNTK